MTTPGATGGGSETVAAPVASGGRPRPPRNGSVVVDGMNRDSIEQNATFQEWQQMTVDQAMNRLKSSPDGLTAAEVSARRALYGCNDVQVQRRGRLRATLWYLWNPLAWLLELALLAALAFGQWVDAAIVALMLLINALICYYGESQTSNAAARLRDQLALKSHVKRDGRWREIPATELTLGDIVSIQDGDVVPADCKLLTKGVLLCDEVALTGQEQSPNKNEGDVCFSGAVVKTGTGEAVVFAIGHDTFFASTVDLLRWRHQGRLPSILARIGNFAIVVVVVMLFLELIVQIGYRRQAWKPTVANAMVLVVGAIPIALPAVLSMILAVGAIALAKKDVVVRRLNAIDELASMDVLCANKSGTISNGRLQIIASETFACNGHTADEVVFYGAMAAQPDPLPESIDQILIDACPQGDSLWDELERLHFVPSDPLQQRSIASVRVRANGNTFRATMGAPWPILLMDQYGDLLKDEVEARVSALASGGFRVVGVGVSRDPADMPLDKVHWELVGLLALKDPPRVDCAQSLQAAAEIGVDVKVISGEELADAVRTCNELGVASNLQTGSALDQAAEDDRAVVEDADGFAELYPEHKFAVIDRLQKLGHVVGISGTSVNDCAALQKADVGIAVPGSVGSARSAADLVLLVPGLTIITDAIILSRIIFRRMHTFALHTLVAAVQVVLTFGLLTLIYNWYYPAFCILIMAVLNDGSLLALARDTAIPSQQPEQWNLRSLFTQAAALGAWLSFGTLILFALARHTAVFGALHLDPLHSYGGRFRVDGGDPVCDWNLWFNPRPPGLGSCPDADLLMRNTPAYEANVWRYYQQTTAQGDTGSDCHQALAQAVCGVQQLRLGKLRSLIYLVVSITGQAVVFAARAPVSMWKGPRPSRALIVAFVVAQLIATLLATMGFGRRFSARTYFAGVGPGTAIVAWIWALILILPMDLVKSFAKRYADRNKAKESQEANDANDDNQSNNTATTGANNDDRDMNRTTPASGSGRRTSNRDAERDRRQSQEVRNGNN